MADFDINRLMDSLSIYPPGSKCPIPCDDDCEEPCHAVHHVRSKRDHEPENCPARRGDRS